MLFVGYLTVQVVLRFNATQLLEARRVGRRSDTHERYLYDVAADAHRDQNRRQSGKRRQAL